MERPAFDEIVERWLADNGNKIKGDINARVFLFFQLFAALEEYGYGKAEAQQQAKLIKASCFNENARSKNKQGWKDVIEKSFKQAIVTYPPWQFKMATYDTDKAFVIPTVYPDIPEELAAQIEEEETEYQTPSEPVKRNEYTPEEWAAIPTPEPLYDEELRILFGFKK